LTTEIGGVIAGSDRYLMETEVIEGVEEPIEVVGRRMEEKGKKDRSSRRFED